MSGYSGEWAVLRVRVMMGVMVSGAGTGNREVGLVVKLRCYGMGQWQQCCTVGFVAPQVHP